METEITTATSTATETPAVTETPATTATAESTWQPDYKFKVLDKEHEIDEWVRPAVKDADTEKKIKEIYTKAYGLDSIKGQRDTLSMELNDYKAKYTETEKALGTLGDHLRSNDFDSFFEDLNIPKEKILQYALTLVERQSMPPEQRAAYEQSKQAQQQARYYQEQNAQLQASQQQFAVQQRTFELDNVLASPELSGLVNAYGLERFKSKCIEKGQFYAYKGNDRSAQEIALAVAADIRDVNPNYGMPQATQVVQASQKPVIPNIQGRGTSAVKSAPRSLDDIRKKSAAYDAQY